MHVHEKMHDEKMSKNSTTSERNMIQRCTSSLEVSITTAEAELAVWQTRISHASWYDTIKHVTRQLELLVMKEECSLYVNMCNVFEY